jgi:KaiC/GvpD/RAD55 family RecA-like ATPase
VSEPSAPTFVGERRLSTGNPELDRMLDGGLMPHRPYLLVGPSGTGKTTLALQFLCEGVRQGERTLFVTVEEPPNEVLWNHRALLPELGRVEVFDAIPDVMRFERTPFKDIAAVRSAVPFDGVDLAIRKTPELTSVEVTISALEQMLRTEVQRRSYTRVVVDSLTALQYFCMKGYEPAAGAQSFLRFLSDLRVTTLLTVESPLEDVESAERMLARGEIRLFRWEHDGVTLRAIGVEKFRGSSHDVRLHPYRIGGHGIDVNLLATISRDTQEVVAAPPSELGSTGEPSLHEPSAVELLAAEVHDLLLVGASVTGIQAEIEAALAAARRDEVTEAATHLSRALAAGAVPPETTQLAHHTLPAPAEAALARILARAETERVGVAPARLPEPPILAAQLSRLLNVIVIGMREIAERAPYPAPARPGELAGPEAPEALVAEAPATFPLAPASEPEVGPPAKPELAPPPAPPIPAPVTLPVIPEVTPSPEFAPAPPSAGPVPAGPETASPADAGTSAPGSPPMPQGIEAPPGLAAAPATQFPVPSMAGPDHEAAPSAQGPSPTPAVVSVAVPGGAPGASSPARAGTHPRAEPPPLPTPTAMAPPRATPLPIPPPPAHGGPNAPAAQFPVPPAPPRAPVEPPPLPSPVEEAPAGARRRKRTTGVRKKADEAPVPPSAAPTPTGGEAAEGALAPPLKPKRRIVRKKKAPPVVAATPGPVPPGVYGSDQPAASSVDPTPPEHGK